MPVLIHRVYDQPFPDGYRVLVDRLWPRGIRKQDLSPELAAWCRELAPSTELRRWFGHEPQKWPAFRQRYETELSSKRDTLDQLITAVPRGQTLVLLYGAKDREHNQAVVLRDLLLERMPGPH